MTASCPPPALALLGLALLSLAILALLSLALIGIIGLRLLGRHVGVVGLPLLRSAHHGVNDFCECIARQAVAREDRIAWPRRAAQGAKGRHGVKLDLRQTCCQNCCQTSARLEPEPERFETEAH